MKNFLKFFWNLASFEPLKPTAKAGKMFRNNNKAWMIHWKVCRKDWHLSGKRPEIGLCRKISSLYKVSSVSNVCLSFRKQVNYKVSSITKTYAVIAEQSDWSRKISLAITRQITQEDINLLLTKTTAFQVFSRSRNDQPMFVNECTFKEGWQSSSLKTCFLDFAKQNVYIFPANPNHTPRLPTNMSRRILT